MHDGERCIDASTIDELFQMLADELECDEHYSFVICGSSALIYSGKANNLRTEDIDVFSLDYDELPLWFSQHVHAVARKWNEHSNHKISSDWLNDDIVRFSGIGCTPQFENERIYHASSMMPTIYYDGANGGWIKLLPASLEAIFIAKITCYRLKDIDHLKALADILNWSSIYDAVNGMERVCLGFKRLPYWDTIKENLEDFYGTDYED